MLGRGHRIALQSPVKRSGSASRTELLRPTAIGDGLRVDDGDGVQERGEDPADQGDGKAITGLEPGMRGSSSKDDELLAEKGVLGEESGARAKHPKELREKAGHKLTNHCGRVSAGAWR
jgi:hypothetical protein